MKNENIDSFIYQFGILSSIVTGILLMIGLLIWSATRVSDSELSILKKDISAQERRMDGFEESLRLIRNQIDNQKEKRQ